MSILKNNNKYDDVYSFTFFGEVKTKVFFFCHSLVFVSFSFSKQCHISVCVMNIMRFNREMCVLMDISLMTLQA